MALELTPKIGLDNSVFQHEGDTDSSKSNPGTIKEWFGDEVKDNSDSPSDTINEITEKDNTKKHGSNTNNSTNTASTTWATTVTNNNDTSDPNDGQISFNKTTNPPLQSKPKSNKPSPVSYGYDNGGLKHSPNGKSDNMLSSSSYRYDDNASDEESQNRRQDQKTSNNDKGDFIVKQKRSAAVSYETIVWIVFFVLTIAILIDRFTGNGDRIFEKKGRKVHLLNNVNWGMTITNYIWAFTARTLIVAQNLMFYTTLSCIPNILVEIAPRWIVTNGIRDTHIKIHRFCGIFLTGIPVIVHVFVMFVPQLVDKTRLNYHPPSEFNYSKQPFHLNWTRLYDPAAVDGFKFSRADGPHITSDEIFRFTLIVVLFGILFPISRSKWLNDRSYTVAIVIHGFAAFMFGIDNVRKMSHRLSWIFNIPLMIVWLIDRFLSIKYYRNSKARIVKKRVIGNNEYVDIRVKLNKTFEKTVGDVYYLLEADDRRKLISFERSHPFTSFSNHQTKDQSWDIGFIITVVEDHKQNSPAWTRKLRSMDEAQGEMKLQSWGPYRSSSNELYKELLLNETSSYVLFGSGSGFGYINDALSILAYKINNNNNEDGNNKDIPTIHIHYSARTVGLLYNFAKETEDKLRLIKEKNTASVIFHWYVTSSDDSVGVFESNLIDIVKGRVNYERIIQRCSQLTSIYFTGRPSISDMVQSFADKYDKRLIKDYVNTQRGTSDKMLIVKYLKYTFYAAFATVFGSLIIGIYLNIN